MAGQEPKTDTILQQGPSDRPATARPTLPCTAGLQFGTGWADWGRSRLEQLAQNDQHMTRPGPAGSSRPYLRAEPLPPETLLVGRPAPVRAEAARPASGTAPGVGSNELPRGPQRRLRRGALPSLWWVRVRSCMPAGVRACVRACLALCVRARKRCPGLLPSPRLEGVASGRHRRRPAGRLGAAAGRESLGGSATVR